MIHRLFRRRATAACRIHTRALLPDPLALAAGRAAATPPPGYDADDRRREFRAVLTATPAARRVLAQILDQCRVTAASHVPGDTHETARREGMRAVGLWLCALVAEEGERRPATAETDPPSVRDGAPR